MTLKRAITTFLRRFTLSLGWVTGFACGVLFMLIATAPPAEDVERARREREKVAVEIMLGALKAYQTSLTNAPAR
jgi:hypothetical protein